MIVGRAGHGGGLRLGADPPPGRVRLTSTSRRAGRVEPPLGKCSGLREARDARAPLRVQPPDGGSDCGLRCPAPRAASRAAGHLVRRMRVNIGILRRHRGRLAVAAAAAVLPLTLLGVGTASAGTSSAGTASRAPRLQAPGHQARLGHRAGERGLRPDLRRPVGRPLPGQDPGQGRRAAQELLRRRAQQPGQLHRAGHRAGAGHGHGQRLRGLDEVHAGRQVRGALSPAARQRLRVPQVGADDRQPAHEQGADLEGLPPGHGQRPQARQHHADQAGPGLRPHQGRHRRPDRGRRGGRPVRGPARGLHVRRSR